jgi:hypothetical protein
MGDRALTTAQAIRLAIRENNDLRAEMDNIKSGYKDISGKYESLWNSFQAQDEAVQNLVNHVCELVENEFLQSGFAKGLLETVGYDLDMALDERREVSDFEFHAVIKVKAAHRRTVSYDDVRDALENGLEVNAEARTYDGGAAREIEIYDCYVDEVR